MLIGVQILGVLFALSMIYVTFLYKKRREFNQNEFAFWIILWAIFIIVTLFPGLLNPITENLKLTRTMDLLAILGFIFIVGLSFNNYVALKKTQKRIENIVRRLAYKESKK